MKTSPLLTILACILFAGISSAFILPAGNDPGAKPVRAITHQVTIHINQDLVLCNLYVVEVRDEKGLLVAPPQSFRPGIITYLFRERGPVSGTRRAILSLNTMIMGIPCPVELNTSPFSRTGTFQVGETYTYPLFPATHPAPPVPETEGGQPVSGKD